MASAFSHAIAAIAIGKVNIQAIKTWRYWLLGAFCAVIPDADAIGFWMGVPYDSMWGHRGITHSFFFALLLAFTVMILFYRNEKIFSRQWWLLMITFFMATASHPILDACTNGGLGVAFFAPFENSRYFFPWQVIQVSPISVTRFFSERGLIVLESEFVYIWIPSLAAMGLVYLYQKVNPPSHK